MAAGDNKQPVIIKKVVKGGHHGHHGGSWKIAYADFVTAMMAFFMLLWLLANTTEEQKQGIADYFSPSTPSLQNSGSDGVLGGQSLDSEGAQNQGSVLLALPTPRAAAPDDPAQDSSVQSMIAEREEDRFQMAQEELQTEIEKDPQLQDFREHIIVDLTPEGMRIQIVDSDDRPMFKSGTAEPLPHTRRILQGIAKIISDLPNRLRISGHTDATPFHGPDGYGNWELSADRANAARRVLSASGVPPERLYEVTGKAGTEPLFPENPKGAANRRISIVLMREAPVLPPGYIR
jgi:chemotaxis protein MotB